MHHRAISSVVADQNVVFQNCALVAYHLLLRWRAGLQLIPEIALRRRVSIYGGIDAEDRFRTLGAHTRRDRGFAGCNVNARKGAIEDGERCFGLITGN